MSSLSSAIIYNDSKIHKITVVVVGSGLAGLSAASQLISKGVAVHMLERFPKPGGNSIKASSGINGASTKFQPGPPLSDRAFYSDTVKSCGTVFTQPQYHKRREDLVSVLVNDSASAIEWLSNSVSEGGRGVDLSVVAQLGGHSFPRTHRGAGTTPPGASLVFTLLGQLKESPLFTLETHCVVTKVMKNWKEHVGRIEGVKYTCSTPSTTNPYSTVEEEEKELHGPVIFATGGFAGDSKGMLAHYRPDLAGFPSTNAPRPGSQDLLTAVGAQLLDMEYVQIHPTSFVDPADPKSPVKFLAAELLRGEGGILLHNGKRFVNEMEMRKRVTEAITSLPAEEEEVRQWDVQLVIDEGVYENANSHVDFYLWKKLMRKTTIAELYPDSKLIETTLETFSKYSASVSGLHADSLKRSSYGHWKLVAPKRDSVVYVGRVTPAIHFTMGGVIIDSDASVLDAVSYSS